MDSNDFGVIKHLIFTELLSSADCCRPWGGRDNGRQRVTDVCKSRKPSRRGLMENGSGSEVTARIFLAEKSWNHKICPA